MNAYINQAINGRPKPLSRIQVGQPINTIYGPGRIMWMAQQYHGPDSINYAPGDPWFCIVKLNDPTKQPFVMALDRHPFYTEAGSSPENSIVNDFNSLL